MENWYGSVSKHADETRPDMSTQLCLWIAQEKRQTLVSGSDTRWKMLMRTKRCVRRPFSEVSSSSEKESGLNDEP